MEKKIFERATVGGIQVKNRLIRSATQELMAENGQMSNRMMQMYEDLSKGGVGLIITGYFTFSTTDNHNPISVQLKTDSNLEPFKKLCEIVHENDTKIVAQLAHLGSQVFQSANSNIYAPSDVIDPYAFIQPKALTTEQIHEIVSEFAETAFLAQKAGFDGVQLHAAHGYLLSKFLSPVYNKRKDEYGGSPEKNSRIILEILQEIKIRCGNDFPVWIKMNCADFGFDTNSLQFKDSKITAHMLDEQGIDAIELSGGTSSGEFTPARSKQFEAYHLEYAKQLSAELHTDVISVGGFRSAEKIQFALQNTDIAAVSLCRSLIREPNLPSRWQNKEEASAKCISCNACFNPKGVQCIFNLSESDRKNQQFFLKMMKQKKQDLQHRYKTELLKSHEC